MDKEFSDKKIRMFFHEIPDYLQGNFRQVYITHCITFKISHILKIYKNVTVYAKCFQKGPDGLSVSAMGGGGGEGGRREEVVPAHLKALMERNSQVAEKKEDYLHEQEDIFYDDGDD